ncbi:MAG: 6-phosphofructokinase [Chloroflexi bacterium]|nr:6-phosphofructokinase [Chloroflexota bacterium]
MKKIAVLASGGDAPGMNAAIRAVTRAARFHGASVWGVWDGYSGLVDHRIEELTSRGVAGIIQRGGCIIGAGRSRAFFEEACRIECVDYLRSEGIEGLVVIGGNGSLQGAAELQELGVPTVVIPGSIDNDIPGTEICIGVDTAINTAVEAIDRIRETASALQRAMIVEVMGRHSGYIAIMSGIATGAEMIITPERPVELDEVFEQMRLGGEHGKRHFIIVLAEGASWSATELARQVEDAPNPYDARYTVLGYIQRGGSPSRFDRILATRMGVAAAEALLDGRSGVLMAWRHNQCEALPLDELPPLSDPWDGSLEHIHRITAT